MEIREGIKYTYKTEGKIAEVFKSLSQPNHFYAKFNNNDKSSDIHINSWIHDFKSGKIKLIEYPYKVGDWVYDINDNYTAPEYGTPKICQITKINDLALTKYYVNKEKHGLDHIDFNIYYRPCFKEELSPKKVKQDYKYLIKFLKDLGLT